MESKPPDVMEAFGELSDPRWRACRYRLNEILLTALGGKTNVECRYFISSCAIKVQDMARLVRAHWGIENTCTECWMSRGARMPARYATAMPRAIWR